MSAKTTRPRLGTYFRNRQEPGEQGLPTMSVTMNDGLVPRDELDRKMDTSLSAEQHLRVRPGDIAYNMMRMWQGACGLADSDAVVSPAYVVLEPGPDIDPRFAYHWFKSNRVLHLLWAYSHGITLDRLRLYYDDFAQIPAAPPPLRDQRRIAAILDECDKASNKTQKIIALKLQRKAALASLLLFRDKSAGTKRLAEIADINPSLSNTVKPQIVSFVAMEDVSDQGRLIRSTTREISEAVSAGYSTFRNGDILVAKITPCFENGKGALLSGLSNNIGLGSTEFHVVRPATAALGKLIYYHTITSRFRHQGTAMMSGSAGQKRVPASFLEDYRIPLPSSDHQRAATTFLDLADREIVVLEARLERLRLQKRGLMQKLLTGDWRVSERVDALMPAGPRVAEVMETSE